MSKVIDFADRMQQRGIYQRRHPVPPIGTPYQPARAHNVRDMSRRMEQAFRGGLGHKGPGGDAA